MVRTTLQYPAIKKLFLVSDTDTGHKCHCGFDQLIMYSFRSFNNLICMIFKFTR